MIKQEDVLKALSIVNDPDLDRDLVSLGMIQNIKTDDNSVEFDLVLTTPACPYRNELAMDAEKSVKVITGAKDVKVNLKANVKAPEPVILGDNHFTHVIAVGSGKGGVGKSTIAVAIASALAQSGASVGLLDSDIYGPNIPRMLGLDHLPPTAEGEKAEPAEIRGMKVVSIGFLVQDGQPLIWRGPMLHSAIKQFLTDFNWGKLDYLVVDMPPGTGDVQLSISQSLPVSGAVIVTTPQQVAVDDAYRAVSMFEKLNVPVLGIVENMAYLNLPDGTKLHVFGEAGGKNLASRLDVPFLGSVPMDPEIARAGDIGSPLISREEQSDVTEAFYEVAENVAAQLSIRSFKIVDAE